MPIQRDVDTLSRRELVDTIAWELGLTQAKAAPVVHKTIDAIAQALMQKRRVELRGLGVFEVIVRSPRTYVHPEGDERVRRAKYTVVYKPSKVIQTQNNARRSTGYSMSLNMSSKPKFQAEFSSEQRARQFASMALSQMPKANVQCSGRRVKITHSDRDGEVLASLMSKMHVKKKKRPVPAQDPRVPVEHEPEKGIAMDTSEMKVYFKDIGDAQSAAKVLRRVGVQTQVSEDERTISCKGDRAKINAVIAKFHGAPEPVMDDQYDDQESAAMAFGAAPQSDWMFQLGKKTRWAQAAQIALRNKGADVTAQGARVTVRRITYDRLEDLLHSTILDLDEIDGKGGKVRLSHIASQPQQVGGNYPEANVNPKYNDPNVSAKDTFYQYVVDFASEVGAAKFADAMRKFGIDIAYIAGGALMVGFQAVLSKTVQDAIARYRGSIKSKKQVKGRPTTSGGGGGFLRSFFRSRPSAQAPTPSAPPPKRDYGSITPPKDKSGYTVGGKASRKKDIKKGVFSFAADDVDARSTHDYRVKQAVNSGHGHVKTFTKGGDIYSHMTKGNYAPYTLVTDKSTGESKRLQGHSSLPVGRATAESAINITKVSGGFMLKFANKALKAAAMLYAARLGLGIVQDGLDYVIVAEILQARRLASIIASAILRRPVKFGHEDKACAAPPAHPKPTGDTRKDHSNALEYAVKRNNSLGSTHETDRHIATHITHKNGVKHTIFTNKKTGEHFAIPGHMVPRKDKPSLLDRIFKRNPRGMFASLDEVDQGKACAIDYIGVAYAVMDAISDQATRAIIDSLSEAGIRAVAQGAHSVIAKIRDPEQMQKIRRVARQFKAKLTIRRGSAGGRAKSASMSAMPRREASGGGSVLSVVIGGMIFSALANRVDKALFVRALNKSGLPIKKISDSRWRVMVEPEDAPEAVAKLKAVLPASTTFTNSKSEQSPGVNIDRGQGPVRSTFGKAIAGTIAATVFFDSFPAAKEFVNKIIIAGIKAATPTKDGRVDITQLSPEDLSKIKKAAQSYGGKVQAKRIGASMGVSDVITSILTRVAAPGVRVARSGVVPGLFIIACGSVIVAHEVLVRLQKRGLKAVLKGTKVMVKDPEPAAAEMAFGVGARILGRAAIQGAKKVYDSPAGQNVRVNALHYGRKLLPAAVIGGGAAAVGVGVNGIRKKLKKRKEPAEMAEYPWDECVSDMKSKYGSEESARKVCGKIKAERGMSFEKTLLPQSDFIQV